MQGKIKLDDANIKKTVTRPAFSVFPNKYLQNSLKRNRGQMHNWFLDCIRNIASEMSNQT
jgi:hypothetical protein